MLSFLRAPHPARTTNTASNPVKYDNGRSVVEFHGPDSNYIMTHTLPPTTPEHGVSVLEPPFHYHIHQLEKFHVRSGAGRFWKGLDPEPFILSAAPGEQANAMIPKSTYHRFENSSETENLVIDIHLTPESYEGEVQFFRNFFGYLDDCKTAKTEPSLFQLLVFLHRADTPLALPLPWHWLGVIVSRAFLIGIAGVGRWVLGYQSNYEEYYEEGKSK